MSSEAGASRVLAASSILGLAALIALSASGCMSSTPRATPFSAVAEVRRDAVPVDVGDFQGVAWIETRSLVVRLDRHVRGDGNLGSLDIETGALAEIDLPKPGLCQKRDLSAPVAVRPSAVAAAETCYQGSAVTRRILLADLQTGEVARLGLVDRIVRSISFYPDGTTAILSLGNHICQGIAELEDARVVPIDMLIATPDGTFNLADEMRLSAAPCDGTGRAHAPALSPDGDLLAFFASAGSVGKSGTARLDATWDLILLRGAEPARIAFRGADEPFNAEWDPSGRWLAFGSHVGGLPGTWIYDSKTEEVTRVSDRTARDLSWSPDGRAIAVVEATTEIGPGGVPLRAISVLDVGKVVAK